MYACMYMYVILHCAAVYAVSSYCTALQCMLHCAAVYAERQ